ncbi:DNA-binding protein [Hymenobacter metallilatus]|uniref:DNA-binding protein n=1 Tax=Hymenobacter metallilatus TaxID=2493666 RepID=A0A3R9NJR4_9BACT|nr:DNA-binding protein [Hymenobacter metallilatus]RSK29878.1 DNA-binding protein [Hymenobacter metallilatus]
MELIDFNQEGIKALLLQAFNEQAREYYHSLPAPDPQYTPDEVAKFLNIDVSTVRSYMKLPVTHPRYLPYVRTTDTAWGNRILGSDLREWQQRHRQQPQQVQIPVPETQMRVAHRGRGHDRRKRGHGRTTQEAA